MMHVVPNSGVMGEDALDRLRSEAVLEHHATPLPEAVVYYLRALEQRFADDRAERQRRAMREIGWTFAPTPETGEPS